MVCRSPGGSGRGPDPQDKCHIDEVVVTIRGVKHRLWRAVGQHGAVLDVGVQRRRGATAVKRLMRKLLERHGRPRVTRSGLQPVHGLPLSSGCET
nr:DDE-type integrase/transposase/recombinase [Burkholderia glumae]